MVERRQSVFYQGLEFDFITPVQFIARLLLDLRDNYFDDEANTDVNAIR
jgi:hypothetical protein